jgi:OmpA-OmpF porin, OOP family
MNINLKPLLLGMAMAFAMSCAAPVASAAEDYTAPAVYLGGGMTQSRFDSDTFTFDHKDHGWKVIAGTRMVRNFGFEANYVDFGRAQAPAGALVGPTGTSATAFSAFGLGIMPVGMVDLYLKAGAARTKAKGQIGGVQFSDHSTDFAYGAGVAFNIANFSLRAEYEKYNLNSVRDLDLITLGAVYNFSTGS